jgi:hypothetical protein
MSWQQSLNKSEGEFGSMNPWALSALCVGLAVVATLLAVWFSYSTTLSKTVAVSVAHLVISTGGAGTVIPTVDANAFFLPGHPFPHAKNPEKLSVLEAAVAEEG